MSKASVLPPPDVLPACCPSLAAEPLSPEQALQVAGRFKALADPVRLRLLSIILSAAQEETCVCDLTAPFAVSQPTISHHLRVLREAGLVESRRRGTWVYYRPRRDALDALGAMFRGFPAPA
ncbi:MAG TPA: metalloregulator ArsR/SmtB family transcription factor [Mycobacteriales bacterium]|nr:metalloregulator ArsR/SmtB family transcription factor [Mycobacteriales bacterium]